MTTHVIFGTGPVGMAVMNELHQRDVHIRMVNRSGKADVPADVEVVAADVTLPGKAVEAAEGASVIYHALNIPYPLWFEVFPKLNRTMIEAAEATGAKLIVMDNLYMYGSTNGQPMTEETPATSHTRKGKLRAELARELLQAHQDGRIRVAIGRASDFFGPGVEDSMIGGTRVVVPAIQGKAAQIIGNPDMPHTYSYVPDVGRALVALADNDTALGKVWHLPVADTLTTRAFINQIYAAAGNPPKIQTAPRIAIRALGLFNPMMREIVEMVYEFEEPFIMDSSRFKAAFGDLSTPLNEAIKQTVTAFRA
jgi:nucleoside-diphosphate-sugar epimerase